MIRNYPVVIGKVVVSNITFINGNLKKVDDSSLIPNPSSMDLRAFYINIFVDFVVCRSSDPLKLH